jgi:tetratricopeptide (TPR) repeat protein
MRPAFLGCAAAVWVAATASWAAAAGSEAPLTGPPPAWVRPAEAVKIAPGPPPTAASARVLLLDDQIRFGPTGDSFYVETIMRAQTAQGLASLGTVSLPWKPDTETLTVHKVNIIRGDQVIDALAGHSFTVLRRETNLDLAMLDGVLTATMQVEGLQVGDALDVAATIVQSDPLMKGHAEGTVGVPALPIERLRVRALWDGSEAVRWRVGDGFDPPKVDHPGATTELTIDMRGVEPLRTPRGAPARFERGREAQFSDFPGWADVSALFAPLYAKASTLPAGSPLKAEAAKIRAASADPAVQAAAALSLVQDKVRYVFLGMNDGGLTPADADVTWSRRFGDCKAKTALLLALLHELGIDSQPALVSSSRGDGLDARLPMVEAFDHVLVRAVIGGKAYWLDGTRVGDQDLAALSVPPFVWALPVQAAGGALAALVQTPAVRPDLAASVTIDASAGLVVPAPIHVEIVFSGDGATRLGLSLANVSPADIDRNLRAFWAKKYDSVEVTSTSAAFDARTGKERLIMDGKASLVWAKTPDGKGRRLEISDANLGWKPDFQRDGEPHAAAPFKVNFPAFQAFAGKIILPRGGEGFTVEGGDVDRTVAGVALKRTARIDSGVLSVAASERSLVSEFPAAEAPAAAKALAEISATKLYLRVPDAYQLTRDERKKVLSLEAKTAEEFLIQGETQIDVGAPAKAIAAFDQAIALNGSSSTAYAGRGLAEILTGAFDKAKTDLDKAAALNPSDADAFKGYGLLAAREGRFADSVAAYTRTLDQNPKDTFTLGQRADAWWNLGDRDKALADAEAGLRIDPAQMNLHEFRADIYRISGQPDLARAELDAAVAARPYDAGARLARASLLATIGRQAEANREFALIVRAQPSVAVYLSRQSYRDPSDTAGRLADVASALKIDPRNTVALVIRAQIEVESGAAARAITELSEAINAEPDDLELRVERGKAYLRTGQSAPAVADFTWVRAKGAANAGYLNELCWAEAGFAPYFAAALSDCDSGLRLNPWLSEIVDSRAMALMRLGRLDEAQTGYDLALRLRPHQAGSLYGRGVTRLRKGLAKEGQSDLAAARAVDPHIEREFTLMGVAP